MFTNLKTNFQTFSVNRVLVKCHCNVDCNYLQCGKLEREISLSQAFVDAYLIYKSSVHQITGTYCINIEIEDTKSFSS